MTTPPTPPASEASLVRALGTWMLAAGIVNVTVGGGIFRLPADMAGMLGAAAPIAYLVCAVAMGLIVLCFADAGSRVAMTGGPYAYVEVAFGPFVGFLAGFLLWMLGTFAMAAVSTVFVASVGALVPALRGAVAGAVTLVAVYAFLGWVNVRGVRHGARFGTVATVAKLLPLLLLIVLGAFAVRGENLRWESTPGPADLARSSILLIFAFAGVEAALLPSGEVKDPARTVPRAILIAMAGITLLYLSLQLVSQGVLGPALAASRDTPLADAAGIGIGGWARTLLLVGATISMFGYVSGMTLAMPRALYAFARDGFLPAPVAGIHPAYGTPALAIAIQAAIVCVLSISSTFERLAILANLSSLVLYGACCLASWQLRRRDVRMAGGIPFRVPAAGIVPFLALAVIAYMLSSITGPEWSALAVALAVASAVFLLTRGRRAARAVS